MTNRHLPAELYTQIFEYFQLTTCDIVTTGVQLKRQDDIVRLHTLCSICLVSSDFHHAAWPILYRVFPFTSDSLGFKKKQTPNHGENRDELYLQTIRRKSSYADALQFIYMDVRHIETGYLSEVPKQGSYEFFLALVLLTCRNIQGFHLTSLDCERAGTSILDEALTRAVVELPGVHALPFDLEAGQHQILRSVTAITISIDNMAYNLPHMTSSWLFQALRSASLETLTFRGMLWRSLPGGIFHDDEIILPRPLVEVQLMHLTTLRLLEYCAGGSFIGSLVSCCPSLTVLEVVWTDLSCSNDYWNNEQDLIAFDQIATAIADHARNLSTLVLDDSDQRGRGYYALAQHTFGRVLSDMPRLRNISVSEYAFYTSEGEEQILAALPKCLQSLRIISPRWEQAARPNSKQTRTLRERCDADLCLLLQERSLLSFKHVVMDHHSYVSSAKDTHRRLGWEAMAVREPRDIYNDDIAMSGWKLCENTDDAAQTLVRSSVTAEDRTVP